MRAPLPTHHAAEDAFSAGISQEDAAIGTRPLTASPSTQHSARSHTLGARDWRRLTALAAIAVALLDAALLQRKHAFFTGGFLATTGLPTVAESVLFIFGLVVVNAALAGPLCAVALVIAERVKLRRAAANFVVFSAGFFPFAAADFLSYEIWSYLGDAFDFGMMFDLTGHRVSELFAVTSPIVSRPLALGCVLFSGVVLTTWALHRATMFSSERVVAPSLATFLRGCSARLVLAVAVVLTAAIWPESFDFGMRRTPSGQFAGRVINRLSDVDMDGAGLLRAPRDSEPFNRAVHPYALDIPGNGVDENNLAGDLPADVGRAQNPPPLMTPWITRPPVVLFVLESFRADVIGATYQGRRVTSVLDALARDGLRVDNAWSHNGFTTQSRFHILSGRLAGTDGGLLLDDFKRQGYEVAYFSAQDDTFGAMPIPRGSVDVYYDARQDVSRRYSTYQTPGSLAVPAQVLEEHIQEFLAARRSRAPLFLYVNFHDTHYPYHHAGLRNLLGIEPLAANLIDRRRQSDLWATYLNAAANVDRAIGRVVLATRSAVGEFPAVIAIGDHGESLFEEGFLGHGYALNDSQTRIPLIVSGLPVHLRTPFGQADLRGAINDALGQRHGASDARGTVREAPDGSVFQYLGHLDHPSQIARLSPTGRLVYDFRDDRVNISGRWKNRASLVLEEQKAFRELVHTWEAIRMNSAGAGNGIAN